jgi:hypothetical protein
VSGPDGRDGFDHFLEETVTLLDASAVFSDRSETMISPCLQTSYLPAMPLPLDRNRTARWPDLTQLPIGGPQSAKSEPRKINRGYGEIGAGARSWHALCHLSGP